jgi:hypothetical protein
VKKYIIHILRGGTVLQLATLDSKKMFDSGRIMMSGTGVPSGKFRCGQVSLFWIREEPKGCANTDSYWDRSRCHTFGSRWLPVGKGSQIVIHTVDQPGRLN